MFSDFWLSDQAVCGCRNASHICMYNILYIYHIINRIFAFCPSLFISLLDLLCWIDCDLRQEAGNLKPATCGSLIHYRIKLPAWRQSCSDCWPAFCTATEEGCWAVGLTLCMSWEAESSVSRWMAFRFSNVQIPAKRWWSPRWLSTFKLWMMPGTVSGRSPLRT